MARCLSCYDFRPDPERPQCTDFADIVSQAEKGCPSCGLLSEVVKATASSYRVSEPEFLAWSTSKDHNISFHVFPPGQDPTKGYDISIAFEGLAEASSSCYEAGILTCTIDRIGVLVSPGIQSKEIEVRNSRSDASWATAMKWISHCTRNHQQCGGDMESCMPRRVVDVFARFPDVVLVENENAVGRYMCLSHCWGKIDMLVTKQENLAKHKERISFKDLTPTIRDAVEITRKMEVRYIWIDSLCIIQDSQSDWEIEGGQMAQIYKNAYMTIAATKSSNGNGGCFTRDRAIELTGIHTDGRKYTARCGRPVFHWYSFLGVAGRPEDFPLFTRGWAYQERILSRRVLHFGEQELFWECMEEDNCECGGLVKTPRHHSKAQYSEGLELGGNGSIWRRKIYEYSQLLLTYPSDKLPALSGLAQREQERRQQSLYLAGLWSDTLISDLIWFSDSSRKIEKGRAPSWSWAAYDGVTNFFDTPDIQKNPVARFLRPLCRILHASCQPKGNDATGEVSSGHITLRGVTRAVTVEDDIFLRLDHTVPKLRIPIATHLPPFNKCCLDNFWSSRQNFQGHGASLHLLWLAQIATNWTAEFHQFRDQFMPAEVSLVLRRINRGINLYERVGIVITEHLLFNRECSIETVTLI